MAHKLTSTEAPISAAPAVVATDPRVQAVQRLFENLRPSDVDQLGRWYSDACYFKDPFNEVHDLKSTRRIFEHMFETLLEPRFVIHDAFAEGDQCFMSWDFHFRLPSRPGEAHRIHGSSHLRFAADGRVEYHRDYWDAAEQFYEKLPVLGAVLRWIKGKLKAA